MPSARQAIKDCMFWSLNENWGDIDKVAPELIYMTHAYRIYLGYKLIISPVDGAVYANNGHADKSWHKIITGRNELAMAMDVFPDCNLLYAFITALRFNFGGIGVYPYAVNGKMKGMLHLDVRPYIEKILWWRNENGEYNYLRHPDDLKFLFILLMEG